MKKKRLVIGILAHVDAGKTTLAESMLYLSGAIRKLGRVDHKDAFLDTNEMERARGITIFSKQAELMFGTTEVTLLDTPGHVDFSAEMERTLQVLDYAVLIISGADGVQGHVETLWRLLKRYGIPVFLFINKMDQDGVREDLLMEQLQKRLDGRCVRICSGEREEAGSEAVSGGYEKGREKGDWRCTAPASLWEDLAMGDEALLERYLEGEAITPEDIAELIA